MKKLMGVLAAFVVLFGLTACGTKYDFTCTGDIEGQKATVNGVVKDGKVSKVVMEMSQEMNSDAEAKAAAEMTSGLASMFEGTGMTVEGKASGKTYKMVMTMDVSKMSEDAKDESGLDMSDLSKDAFIKSLEDEGLTCK